MSFGTLNKSVDLEQVKQILEDQSFKDLHSLSDYEAQEILIWIQQNVNNIKRLSLFTPVHLAQMMHTNKNNWQRLAKVLLK